MSIDKMTTHARLCAAIGIVQDHILAADTTCDPEKLFTAGGRFSTSSLELAELLLQGVLEDIEVLKA